MKTKITDTKSLKSFLKAASQFGLKERQHIKIMVSGSSTALEEISTCDHLAMFFTCEGNEDGTCFCTVEMLSKLTGSYVEINDYNGKINVFDGIEKRSFVQDISYEFEGTPFPGIEAKECGVTFTSDLKAASKCASKDPDRKSLQVVKLYANGDMAGTDGRCLCMKHNNPGINCSIIPNKALLSLGEILYVGASANEDTNIIFGKNWIYSQEVLFRKYPNVYSIIPPEFKHSVVIPKNVIDFIRKHKSCSFGCTITSKKLVLEYTEDDKTFCAEYDVSMEAEEDYKKAFRFDSLVFNCNSMSSSAELKFNDDELTVLLLKDSGSEFYFMGLRKA